MAAVLVELAHGAVLTQILVGFPEDGWPWNAVGLHAQVPSVPLGFQVLFNLVISVDLTESYEIWINIINLLLYHFEPVLPIQELIRHPVKILGQLISKDIPV